MNLALAIKNYKRRETFKFIVQIVAFLGFIAFGIFTLIVVI
jgi:type IV secretory pathway TrbL component